MRILITNDDGFESEGLRAIVDAIKEIADVTVVAPTTEKSACGHSLTLTKPMMFKQIEDDFFKLDDGTPSDCVYLALNALFSDEKRPDLVVSGINKGANLGEDITYSGTASAAMEAVLQGIPAVAFSQFYTNGVENIDFTLAKFVVKDLVSKILNEKFPLQKRQFLNVNIPDQKEFKGYKVVRAGNRIYANEASLYTNPKGEQCYWIGLPSYKWQSSAAQDCDLSAVTSGFVSITPIHLDMTAYEQMRSLKRWIDSSE